MGYNERIKGVIEVIENESNKMRYGYDNRQIVNENHSAMMKFISAFYEILKFGGVWSRENVMRVATYRYNAIRLRHLGTSDFILLWLSYI